MENKAKENVYNLKNFIKSNFLTAKDAQKHIRESEIEIDILNKGHTRLTQEEHNLLKTTRQLLLGIILIDGAFGTALSFFILKYIFGIDPTEFNNATAVALTTGITLSTIIIHTISFLVQRELKRQGNPKMVGAFKFFSKPQTPLYFLLVFPASTMLVVARKLSVLNPPIKLSSVSNNEALKALSGEYVTLGEYCIICLIALALTFIVMYVVKEHAATKVEEEEKKLQQRLRTQNEIAMEHEELKRWSALGSKTRRDTEEAITKLMFFFDDESVVEEDITQGFDPDERKILKRYLAVEPVTGETMVDEQGELKGSFVDFWYSL